MDRPLAIPIKTTAVRSSVTGPKPRPSTGLSIPRRQPSHALLPEPINESNRTSSVAQQRRRGTSTNKDNSIGGRITPRNTVDQPTNKRAQVPTLISKTFKKTPSQKVLKPQEDQPSDEKRLKVKTLIDADKLALPLGVGTNLRAKAMHIIKEMPETRADTKALENDLVITQDEEKNYGKRFPNGYERIRLLGRGGQGLVFLAARKSDNASFAVKHILLGGYITEKQAKKEAEISHLIFSHDFENDNIAMMGLSTIIKIEEVQSTNKDVFLVMPLCGQALSKLIYSVKGEFLNSERIYRITNNTFFYDMRTNFDLFRKFITQLLIGLHTLASCGIVHCDLKPENILVKYNPATKNTDDVKIVDFGAAFVFDGAPFLTVTTPEYLPPEFLQLFSHKKSLNNRQKHSILVKSTHPWSIDVWSLGVIILEMLVGIPVWMSFKCVSLQVEKPTLGLFSSPSRDHEKIADKIVKFLPNLKRTLNDQVGNLPHLSLIGDLLEQMLALDPLKRPSPLDLLGHSLFSV